MAKSTRQKTARKADRQDARPFAHATGRWAKKCRGQLIYLGKVSEHPMGEATWNRWLDSLRMERTPNREHRSTEASSVVAG